MNDLTENLDKTIFKNEKALKKIEKQLNLLNSLRLEAGLKPQASIAFVDKLPTNLENVATAIKNVNELSQQNTTEWSPTENHNSTSRASRLSRKAFRNSRI